MTALATARLTWPGDPLKQICQAPRTLHHEPDPGPDSLAEKNAERTLILFANSAVALIIVFAVFERFILKHMVPWSTSIPVTLFLWVTWIGCSHKVRQRNHLVFNDLRLRMSCGWQFA